MMLRPFWRLARTTTFNLHDWERYTMIALRLAFLVIAAIACGGFVSGAGAADLPTKKALSLEVARQVAAAAEKHAKENKWNVCIAIVDDGGHLVYFQRIDGTQYGSVEVSQRKAASAIAFKRPTKVFEEL